MRFFLLMFVCLCMLPNLFSADEEELGPHFVRKCPKCGIGIVQPIILAGNTVGATFWSDGKMEAPMLPDCPKFVKCPNCSTLLWIDEAKKVMPPAPDSVEKEPIKKVNYLFPSENDYYAELERGGNSKRKAIYLRFRAWHLFNDKWRNNENVDVPVLSGNNITNLKKLGSLLNGQDDSEVIMKAEIYRELGDFDGALALMDRKFDKRLAKIVDFLKEQCRNKNRKVVEIKEELFDQGDNQGNVMSWLEISIWGIVAAFLCLFGIHTVRSDKKKQGSIVYDLDGIEDKPADKDGPADR